MDKYDVYQHLMNYWNEVMQDDCYLIAVDGWKAELSIIKQTKSATVWDCDLVPKTLVIDRYFLTEKKAIEKLEAEKETIATQLTELEEEHSVEEGYFADLDKVNKANVQKRLKELLATKPKAKKQNLAIAAEPEADLWRTSRVGIVSKTIGRPNRTQQKNKRSHCRLGYKSD